VDAGLHPRGRAVSVRTLDCVCTDGFLPTQTVKNVHR
jgi:hypothetical protein